MTGEKQGLDLSAGHRPRNASSFSSVHEPTLNGPVGLYLWPLPGSCTLPLQQL